MARPVVDLVAAEQLLGELLAGPQPGVDDVNRAGRDRSRHDLLGSGPIDDVPDPYGGPFAGYQATASLLDRLTSDLVAQCLA